ncbi:MAG: pyridoxal-dependent decarboxylase [Acidobacteriota bacterium]
MDRAAAAFPDHGEQDDDRRLGRTAWGWVAGTGTPTGVLAEMIVAGMNSSAGTFNDATTRVEGQVLSWMRDLFRFPEGSSGLVTSGGSVANLVGLAVARDATLNHDVRREGLPAAQGRPVLYASKQVHSSVPKAVQLLGLGLENLRLLPVDAEYRFDLEALEARIAEDRRAGCQPFAVVASAGTVNTGAIDDLVGLADIAAREGLWLHVDGAIGALAVLAPSLRPRLAGIERADSLAFDFHKWLYVPYEAGCVLVRRGDEHRRSFTAAASYLQAPPRGVAAEEDPVHVRGPQLSRGFKALKVWAQIREHGFDQLGRLMAQNVEHVGYLAQRIRERPELELMAMGTLNILCFRFRPSSLPAESWDDFNRELLMRIQEQGIAVPSSTVLEGRFALRVANSNQRTRRSDFDLLVEQTLRLGRALEEELRGS